ncbi:MAG TPA: hypothetical protein VJ900_02000 [Patescibacteria group bacterium]|nr:hypothetical protein [Patescibacteria group bacterium]
MKNNWKVLIPVWIVWGLMTIFSIFTGTITIYAISTLVAVIIITYLIYLIKNSAKLIITIGTIILIATTMIVHVPKGEIVIVDSGNITYVKENTFFTTPFFCHSLTYVKPEKTYKVRYGIRIRNNQKMVWDFKLKLKRFADKAFVLNLIKEFGLNGWEKRLSTAVEKNIRDRLSTMHPNNHLPLEFNLELNKEEKLRLNKLGYRIIQAKAQNGRIFK